jgi:thioredoxin 1
MGNVIEITDSAFEKEIINSAIPAIVDFWAEWCVPCKAVSSVIDEVAEEFRGKIKVCKINIDDNMRMATDLAVMNLPALVFFKDGEEISRLTGVISKGQLRKRISELLNE